MEAFNVRACTRRFGLGRRREFCLHVWYPMNRLWSSETQTGAAAILNSSGSAEATMQFADKPCG